MGSTIQTINKINSRGDIDMIQWGRVLTFFAHPDDETLAAGATIRKLVDRGAEVHVAIPATGIHSRRNVQTVEARDDALLELRQDCETALGVLGVDPRNIYLGDFPDNEMDKRSLLDVVHWLELVVDRVKPGLILTHHFRCTNIDHRYCHEAVVVATRPNLTRHITILCGEVPSSTGYLKPTCWEPNFYVEVTEAQLEAKLKAMETYKGEIRPDPHPRSRQVLKALAKVRGSEAGCYYAEAFMVQKLFD